MTYQYQQPVEDPVLEPEHLWVCSGPDCTENRATHDMVRELMQDRTALYESTKHLWEQRDRTVTRSEADRMAGIADEIAQYDKRVIELFNQHQELIRFERKRKEFETVVAPLGGSDSQGRRMTQEFQKPGFKQPYLVRESVRKMSDEEVFWRDWLSGREPQKHIDVDLSAIEASRNDAGQWEVRDVTVDGQGTNLVPETFGTRIYRHLIANNAMISAGATVYNTPHGRDFVLPKSTVRGTAAIVGEGTALAESDPSFSSLTLNSWKYGQLLQISNEMLEDTEVDLVNFIAFDSGRALGLASGADYATGTGTLKPRGIMTAAAADLGTAVQIASATVEFDNLIDLLYSVTSPYRARGAVWLMNDATAKAVRKVKNSSDEYVWQPSQIAGQPADLLGYPVFIDPSVASIASAALSVGFGDPSVYAIRQAPIRFERSDDFAFSTDLVTYRAVLRSDGDLLDASATGWAVLDTD